MIDTYLKKLHKEYVDSEVRIETAMRVLKVGPQIMDKIIRHPNVSLRPQTTNNITDYYVKVEEETHQTDHS